MAKTPLGRLDLSAFGTLEAVTVLNEAVERQARRAPS